jgi:aerobic-type carbon monoxide dehydrogenase small subunit (CoxS/CutS family)
MKNFLYWCDRKIPFTPGEMLAYTLLRECRDSSGFGKSPSGQILGLFCGIGACQGCLVAVEGRGSVEACLTPSQVGIRVQPIQTSNHDRAVATKAEDDD